MPNVVEPEDKSDLKQLNLAVCFIISDFFKINFTFYEWAKVIPRKLTPFFLAMLITAFKNIP